MVLGRVIKNILMMEELVFINSYVYYCYDFLSYLSNNLLIICNLINKKKILLFIFFKKLII